MSNWGDPNQRPAEPPYGQPQPTHGRPLPYEQPHAQPQPYGQPQPHVQHPTSYSPPQAHGQPDPGSYAAAQHAQHLAQLDAMHRSADRQAVLIRWGIGAALLAFLFFRTYRQGLSGVAAVCGMLAVVLVAFVVGGLVSRSMTGGRHRAVMAARPGLEVVEAWGARGLHAALSAAGITPTRVRKTAATSLSVVPSDQGIELWTGRRSTAAVLVAIPWSSVVAIDESRGSITNDGTRPAIMLVTAIGQNLLLVPRRRTNGGRVLAARDLRVLVARLEELRVRALGR